MKGRSVFNDATFAESIDEHVSDDDQFFFDMFFVLGTDEDGLVQTFCTQDLM